MWANMWTQNQKAKIKTLYTSKVLDKRSNVTASIAEHLEVKKWNISFTHGIKETSDKLKWANYNWETLHSENAMGRVLHERSNIAF